MGKLKILTGLAIAGALVLVLLFPLIPAPVWADDVTVYPTEDTYIREDFHQNYGTSTHLDLCNDASNKIRSLIRIDDQSGGGNVTSVLLKLYWFDLEGVQPGPGYRPARVYRVTRDFVEMEADWYEWADGSSWTSEGGDYTTLHYAEAYFPSSYPGWVTWNITDMALDAWGDSDDLYVLVKFVTETKSSSPLSFSWCFFRSNEYSGSTYDPRVVVTFEESVQTPEVDSDIDEYGSNYVDLNIYPTLYDWPSANVTAQVAPHGGPWSWESSVLTVTDNNAVQRTVGSLNKSTEYDVRAKLVYASGTVYSSNSTFTTPAYTMPTWDIDADDITVTTATLHAGWTGNSDSKTIYAKIAYKREDLGSWTYTTTSSSSATSADLTWNVTGLQFGRTYDYKGRYTIDGYIYETDVDQFTTLDLATLNVTVSDVTAISIQLRCDYECGDISEIDLWSRMRLSGTTNWQYISDTRESLTGNGTEYFVFDNLLPVQLWEWEVRADFDGGTTVEGGETVTIAIDEYPELTNLDSVFVLPNIIRVSCDVELNDVSGMDPELYCKYQPTADPGYDTSHDRTEVTSDGEWSVDLICGDELDWETWYDFYLVLDYVAGTEETDADQFYTPDEPVAVVTQGVTGISGTSAYFRAWGQPGEYWPVWAGFEYWVQGSQESTFTTSDQVALDEAGGYQVQVDSLVYGEYYTMRAVLWEGTGTGIPLAYGENYQFRAGYWGEYVPPGPPGEYSIYGEMIDFLVNSPGGHWLILLVGMGILALIFHKQKAVAVICCLVVLGIGIVIGWVDTWVVVLLAIGAGVTIWRFVRSSGQTSSV